MKLQSIERSSIDRRFGKANPLIAKFRGNAQDIPEGGGGGEGRGIDGTRRVPIDRIYKLVRFCEIIPRATSPL